MHPTRSELLQYRYSPRDLPSGKKLQIYKHLHECEDCYASIPPVTVEDVGQAFLLDRKFQDEQAALVLAQRKSKFRILNYDIWNINSLNLFKLPAPIPLLMLLAFVCIVGTVSALYHFQVQNVANNFQIKEGPESSSLLAENNWQNNAVENTVIEQTVNTENYSLQKSDESNQNKEKLQGKVNSAKQGVEKFRKKQDRSTNSSPGSEAGSALIYSELRSLTKTNSTSNAKSVCTNVVMDVPSLEADEKGMPTFRWSTVPQAAKYHFYLSDLNQNLIDEFESESETFYKTKVPLKDNFVYQGRLIATLKSGERQSSESIRFSIGKTNKNKRKVLSKKINGTRCVPN